MAEIVGERADVVYAEDPIPRVTRGSQLAGQGTVQLLVYHYTSMVVRYPSAVSAVSGAGLAAPAAF